MDYIERFKMKEKPYNFDIIKMIDIFNFDDFIKRGKKRISNSAILLITNNQYIISYTQNKGKGYHSFAFTRLLKELNGGGDISTLEEAIAIKRELDKYVHARILFEKNSGAIIFSGIKNINTDNYNILLKFYDDYNDIIKKIASENGFFVGFYSNTNKNFISSKDLDKLLQYINNNMNITEPESSCDDEIILGNTLDERKHKL